VAIRNEAASRIATVSATVTSTTGAFMVARSRCASARPVVQNFRPISEENDLGYAGIGIAMLTLIESNVRVTIRQSDSEPIASEAATASINRDEATGAARSSKPAAPGDRLMTRFLWPSSFWPSYTDARANHPRHGNFAAIAGNIAAANASKMAKRRRK
jgi:hypothetical protein